MVPLTNEYMVLGSIHGELLVMGIEKFDNIVCLVVDCFDHNEFKRLPPVVKYEGQRFGKTGWDSDKCVAYFRTDAKIAEF